MSARSCSSRSHGDGLGDEMRFVLAKTHAKVPWAWWLRLDESSRPRALEAMIDGTLAEFRNSLAKEPNRIMTDVWLLAKWAGADIDIFQVIDERVREGGWFVNRAGGMCKDMHRIARETEADDWPNPDPELCETPRQLYETAKFSWWGNGDHVYVRLSDGRDVEWGGECKWDSEREAREATCGFLGLERTVRF